MLNLGVLGANTSDGVSVNDSGDVAGTLHLSNLQPHAFLYSSGVVHDLDPAHPNRQSFAFGMNSNAAVVGEIGLADRAVKFKNGTITSIPLGSFDFVTATAINSSGQISGIGGKSGVEHAVLITGQTVKELKPITAGVSMGLAINELGDVCGEGNNGSHGHAIVWSGSTKKDMGTISGFTESACNGLNDFGLAVGTGSNFSSFTTRAIVFDSVNGAVNLNTRIASNSGVVITTAVGVSDTGYIAANCKIAGVARGCLLVPNSVLILKKNIFALEQNDPGCIQCRTVLDPEAKSLPNSLSNLSSQELKAVVATAGKIKLQLQQIEQLGQITASHARLLIHQAQLLINAAG
jgi:probable HAF family extracellular repeat protein